MEQFVKQLKQELGAGAGGGGLGAGDGGWDSGPGPWAGGWGGGEGGAGVGAGGRGWGLGAGTGHWTAKISPLHVTYVSLPSSSMCFSCFGRGLGAGTGEWAQPQPSPPQPPIDWQHWHRPGGCRFYFGWPSASTGSSSGTGPASVAGSASTGIAACTGNCAGGSRTARSRWNSS